MPVQGSMPYFLEKGAVVRLVERYGNGSTDQLLTGLEVMRASAGRVDWILQALPELWAGEEWARGPATAEDTRRHILEHWLGYTFDGVSWVPAPGDTTGYWVAYRGDVNEIVRRTLIWAVELALGLAPGTSAPVRRRPWPIEGFWKCLGPWFECWVTSRPTNPSATRGLVQVLFVTPSHDGALVAHSPLAHHASTHPAGLAHDVPSWQDDYEVLGRPHPDPAGFPGRPRVPASQREFGMWVVTHEQHQAGGPEDLTTNTVGPTDFAEWGVPQVNVYRGVGDVVVVAPAMAAGGVKWDGRV